MKGVEIYANLHLHSTHSDGAYTPTETVIAAKEDEIKKGQQTFIKRAIAAIIVFFVIQIVQIIVRFVSGNDQNIASCFNCFINGKAETGACEITVVE